MFCIAGAVKYLQQRFDIQKWQMRGASAGALVATLAACNVDSEVAFECAHRLSAEKKLFERPLGLAGTVPLSPEPSSLDSEDLISTVRTAAVRHM